MNELLNLAMATPEDRKHYEESAKWAEDIAAASASRRLDRRWKLRKIERRLPRLCLPLLQGTSSANKAPSRASSRPRPMRDITPPPHVFDMLPLWSAEIV